MPRYKLFYLRDPHVQRFRESAPKPKPYGLRVRDYEEAGEIEAPGPYAVWKRLREESGEQRGGRVFGVGDALEEEPSSLVVLNHWGFDEAEWQSTAPEAEGDEAEAEQVTPSAAEAR